MNARSRLVRGLAAALLCVSLAATLPAAASAAETGKSAIPNLGIGKGATAPAKPAGPTAAEAKAFAEQVDKDLKNLWTRAATADWVRSTHITEDTEQLAAWANEAVMEYLTRAIPEAARFDGVAGVDPTTKRLLTLVKFASTLPAPKDPARRKELAELVAKLEGIYGKGKWCGADGKQKCRDLDQLSDVLAKSRKWDELVDAWVGWHTISVPMRPLYAREVQLLNEGAREINFQDAGALWRSNYDMTPAEFEAETDRLWQQVKPLYDDLHCYVRANLQKQYGKDKVPEKGPIPAHLLGNMWAQEWSNLYPILEPYKGQPSLDVDAGIKKKKWTSKEMVKVGENFFVSLGFPQLPETFWQRSLLEKPKDREVVCHASAWDVTLSNDLRIKMCIKPTEEDLVTIHHELGHNYYYSQYFTKPVLFQSGANDGFHEAIGDALALSITPGYLKQLGLIQKEPKDQKGTINVMMKSALSKVAFLPFGKLVDQWRWDVFSGKTPPEKYNAAWWELRTKYQGVSPPVARSEANFDPGAKFHIPGNTPYMRYFLATILQFQFHRAMCQAAGHKGPLHTCSIYGSKEAGAKLKAMLAMGAEKPWPDALEALTGQRQMDASAILDYYAPLHAWLKEQNKGRTCGW